MGAAVDGSGLGDAGPKGGAEGVAVCDEAEVCEGGEESESDGADVAGEGGCEGVGAEGV